MKAILISIKPKWVAKILNGEKTIEVRKSKPKCELPIDVYIYCTKDKELLHKNCVDIYWVEDKDFQAKNKKFGIKTQPYLNGKVVAKFTLNKVDEYKCSIEIPPKTTIRKPKVVIVNRVDERGLGEYYWEKEAREILEEKILKNSCLTESELAKYLERETNVFSGFYAWYISNLVIFDRPRELGEFKHYNKPHCDSCPFQYSALCEYHIEVECDDIPLTKAPQSWQFIEVGDK